MFAATERTSESLRWSSSSFARRLVRRSLMLL